MGKLDEQGLIVCYKVRLVSKGFVQKDGVDYAERFAPVIPFDVLLLIVREFIPLG